MKMRVLVVLFGAFWLMSLVLATGSLARQGTPPKSLTHPVSPIALVPMALLPPIDIAEQTQKSEQQSPPGTRQIALPYQVTVSSEHDGTWETLAGGGTLWRHRFSAKGATDLNFRFSRFRLPPGATLHILSTSEQYYEGPYTSIDHKAHGELWSPMVPGDEAVVELFVPEAASFSPLLEISQVGVGFSDFLGRSRRPSVHPKQGSCNIDVACPSAKPWRDQVRSVGQALIGGTVLCTGTLINDVPGSMRPFFLTAAHCGISAQRARSVVVYWNFESPRCGALGGGSFADNQTGSRLLASRDDADVTLLELDELPDRSFDVFFSGWDRSGTPPPGGVSIHHPNGDEKAISFDFDPLTSVSDCTVAGSGPLTHWEVSSWDRGVTEPGSSGAGLWDPQTKRLVGVLTGGASSCRFWAESDCYGKFAAAWDGPSPRSRLRDHLDPGNTGAVTVAGVDPGSATVENDDFVRAVQLRGLSGRVGGTNIGATAEAGEPRHAGVRPRRSVWWLLKAKRAGKVVLSTAGSNFDTVLAVYSGGRLQNLRAVASNDDAPRLGRQSQVRFHAAKNRTYYIAIDGYQGTEGDIVLRYRTLSSPTRSVSLAN